MELERVRRSYLFVPANRPERIAKAQRAGADAVIVDLEDAVAPSEKSAAREALTHYLDAAQPVLLRINGVNTPWATEDLKLCTLPGVSGVLLPKAEHPAAVTDIAQSIGPDKIIVPIIETARGFDNAREIAATGNVTRFAFGSIDFQVDLGINGETDELLYFRSQLVLVSRLAELLPPIDGVTVSIDDAEVLRSETQRGRRLGFGAKLCIHPKQIPIVNSCYKPTEEEVAWAQRVVRAAASSKGSALAVDGKMVDAPVIRKAEEILSNFT